jgi:hypothetical protein
MYIFPLKEGAVNIGKTITKALKKPFDAIMKPIKMIIDYIKCAIKLIINLPKCLLYYGLDTLGFIFYLPFSILFWIFGAKKQERLVWRGIDKIDKAIYNQSGYHIFHYSESIMNKCYRCIPKKAKKMAKKMETVQNTALDKLFTGESIKDTKATPDSIVRAILMVIMFIVLSACAVILILYIFKIPFVFPMVAMHSAFDFIKYASSYASSKLLPVVSPTVIPTIDNTKPNPDATNNPLNYK